MEKKYTIAGALRFLALLGVFFLLGVSPGSGDGGCASTSLYRSAEDSRQDTMALQAEKTAQRLAAPEEEEAKKAEAAGDKHKALQHYVAALQSLPPGDISGKDIELRRDIISLALSMTPPPATPEGFQEHFDRATILAMKGDVKEDELGAAAEYEKALRLAPWVASAYYNMGSVLDLAGCKRRAARYLRIYLLASPNAQDREKVRGKILDIETSLDVSGRWFDQWDRGKTRHFEFDIHGDQITMTEVQDATWRNRYGVQFVKGLQKQYATSTLQGRRFSGKTWYGAEARGEISQDCNTITFAEFEQHTWIPWTLCRD